MVIKMYPKLVQPQCDTQVAEESSISIPAEISSFRYDRILKKITLLRVMGEITNHEVKRIISLVESPDMENWTVAEETVKNLLSVTK